MKTIFRATCFTIAAVFILPNLVYGQAVTGTIMGVVIDPSGSMVPGALVTVRSVETGTAKTVTTNDVGSYSIPFLNPGTYTLEASHSGFKTFVQERIEVQVASTVMVDVRLQLGETAEKIVVSEAPPLLQTEGAQVASTLDRQQLQQLPSLDRKYQDLISLMPGTGVPEQNFTDLGSDDTRLTKVNGLGKYSNNYQIDGVDNNDPILGNTVQVPPMESIQEVNVATSNYDAEFGRAGGAVVNVQTQGGTNQFHGSAYEFHRDNFLRAFRAWPREDSLPKYVQNQYGATVGGPIIKNRTFFFGDFEGTNIRMGQTQILNVPIPAFRVGDFSSVLGEPLGVMDPAGQPIYSGSLFDPLTGNPDGSGRRVFPGNIIPPDRFSPQAKGMIDLLPLPDNPDFTQNYTVRVPTPRDTYNFDVRVDHVFNSSTNLFAKYNFKNMTTDNPYSSALRPDGFLNGHGELRAQNLTGNLTHSFGANTVTEVRVGINRFNYTYEGLNQRTAQDFGIGGMAADTPLPLMYFYDGSVTDIGFYPYYPLVNDQSTYQVSNTWTKTKGKHNVKWGADIRVLHLTRDSRSSNTGQFTFDPNVTNAADESYTDLLQWHEGRAFSSFLLGLPDYVFRDQHITAPRDHANEYFFFGQDTWQATPKLSLNVGLRWEYYAPVTAPEPGGASNYDPYTGRLIIAGLGNVSPAADVKGYYRNFAPRFGFAQRLDDKTVLRGGYGISFVTHPFGGVGALLTTNWPNVSVQTAGLVEDFLPEGTLAEMIPLSLPELPSNGILDPAPPDQYFYSLPFDNKFPYVQSYNLTLQRELLPDLSVEVGYVGNQGRRLFNEYEEQNYSLPGSGDDGGRLYKNFGFSSSDALVAFDGNSNYNSLQINVQKRLSHGIAFTTAYTWQRGINDIRGGDSSFPHEFRRLGRGVNTNKQQLVSSYLWELPFGPKKPFLKAGPLSRILGGWQFNGIFTSYSGPPFSVLASPVSLNGVRLRGNHPDVIGTPTIEGHTGPDQLFFDVNAFRPPATGVYGNAGAQLLYGPGRVNWDASLFRKIDLRESKHLEFRVEVFNLTNTPHWTVPQRSIDEPRFGEISSAVDDARKVQFGVRFVY
jgi:outer membrane receptor protein involved in Fe transport